jgi:hypothetical protein
MYILHDFETWIAKFIEARCSLGGRTSAAEVLPGLGRKVTAARRKSCLGPLWREVASLQLQREYFVCELLDLTATDHDHFSLFELVRFSSSPSRRNVQQYRASDSEVLRHSHTWNGGIQSRQTRKICLENAVQTLYCRVFSCFGASAPPWARGHSPCLPFKSRIFSPLQYLHASSPNKPVDRTELLL